MRLRKRLSLEMVSFELLLGLGSAVGSLVLFAWLSDEVLNGATASFDNLTRSRIHRLAFSELTTVMVIISILGSTPFLVFATTVTVLLFFSRRWRRDGLLFTVTMVGASILNTTLKLAFHRQRPVPYFDLPAPASFSFPSGHALAGFCFYAGLASILSTRVESLRTRILMWSAAMVLVLLIGFSRIYLGVHYTTDVIAGYCAALIWIMMVRLVEVQLARRRMNNSREVRL